MSSLRMMGLLAQPGHANLALCMQLAGPAGSMQAVEQDQWDARPPP